MGLKAEWYNHFYESKEILTTYSWYEGLSKLKSRNNIDFSNKKVLEIGSGAGEFLSTVHAETVVGIDISSSGLRLAKSRMSEAFFVQAKAEQIPFLDDTFDIIVCCEVLEHVDSMSKVIAEMRRLLRPNGMLFISFPNYLNPIYTGVRWLAKIFRRPNWISLQIVDRYLFYFSMMKRFKNAGFDKVAAKGTCYSHHKIPVIKIFNRFEPLMDSIGLQFLSFHPVILFRKTI
ncbi:MAG: class I SAM-dependent methyltransferase [Fibrobacteres bacterium]|nr:class I SAM-dependent methyltransferase [Fibrobacterota bacterium]